MTGINDRPIGVLDRPSVLSATAASRSGDAHTTMLRQASQPTTSRPTVPRGWGSREERSIMRWGLPGFFLLAMYGVVFVLLGALVWS